MTPARLWAPVAARPRHVMLGVVVCAELVRGLLAGPPPRPPAAPFAGRATVLEAPRTRSWGGSVAMARLGSGARALLVARGRPWPREPVGAEVRIRGRTRPLSKWESWAERRGAGAAIEADVVRATGRRRGGLLGAVDRARARAEAALTARLPRREGALLRGMVLGQDEAVAQDVRDDFRVAGLSHVLAASGENVVLLAALALPVLAALGFGLRGRLIALLALIALYVPLAGGGPSIQRAGIMGLAGTAAALAGRPADRVYGLLLAAAGTLVLSPRAAGDPGWQLSFAAVIAIALIAGPLARRLTDRGWPRGLAQAVGVTVAATVGTAPLLAHVFGRVSLASLPVNVLAAPVVAGVMWIGMAATALAQVAPAGAALVALPALPLLGFLEWLTHAAARAPDASVGIAVGSPLVVAALYACLVAFVRVPRLRAPVAVGVLAAAGLALSAARAAQRGLGPPAAGTVRFAFLDIGQGDATLVQSPGHAVLVDAGPPDGPVLRRLTALGVGALDAVVVTHDQADHEGAMARVLRAHPVGLVLDGASSGHSPIHQALVRAAARRGVRRIGATAGETVTAGPIALRLLWPRADEPPAPGEDPNLRAVVAYVDAAGVRALLTADAESDVTAPLATGRIDLLKVAHHGSEDDGLPDELATLRPRLAAIEVGRHNSYGHPTPQALRALRAAVPDVERTDRDGTIVVTAQDGRWSVAHLR